MRIGASPGRSRTSRLGDGEQGDRRRQEERQRARQTGEHRAVPQGREAGRKSVSVTSSRGAVRGSQNGRRDTQAQCLSRLILKDFAQLGVPGLDQRGRARSFRQAQKQTMQPRSGCRRSTSRPLSSVLVRPACARSQLSAFRLSQDGRVLSKMYLMEVKTPAASRSPDDVYKILADTVGEQAFRPLTESDCPLIRK